MLCVLDSYRRHSYTDTDGPTLPSRYRPDHREQLANVRQQDLTILWLEECDAIAISTPDKEASEHLCYGISPRPCYSIMPLATLSTSAEDTRSLLVLTNANAGLRGHGAYGGVATRVGVLGMHWVALGLYCGTRPSADLLCAMIGASCAWCRPPSRLGETQ